MGLGENKTLHTIGCSQLIIVTDHKPLICIIKGDERALNVRLMRLKQKLTTFSIADIWHTKGTANAGPDALSQHTSGVPTRNDDSTPNQVMLLTRREVGKMTYQDIESASRVDKSIKTLCELIRRRFEITSSESRKTDI